ncbi:MAG: hypothetical protein ACRCX8_15745 [Sarcina sp.]
MGTPFQQIEDLAMVSITDYKLDNLYRVDQEAFWTYLDGFLVTVIPQFIPCFTSLDYDLTNRTFNETLDLSEISILSNYLVLAWMKKEINDVTQMNLHFQGKDFKTHSEAQNLKSKIELSVVSDERVNQEIMNYQLKNLTKIPFFGGP